VLQLQAEQPLVGAKHGQPQPVGNTQADPLIVAAAQRGRRAGVIGDAALAAAERQNLDELVEDDPVGDARAVAAERVMELAGGQQGGELDPAPSGHIMAVADRRSSGCAPRTATVR
jgi:hypothetical protein